MEGKIPLDDSVLPGAKLLPCPYYSATHRLTPPLLYEKIV